MIRFGIVGTNWITDRFLEAAAFAPEFKLEAVYSRTEERAHVFAEKYGATYTYTTIKELAESDQVDAVYIASPNSFHAEHAIELMAHGKHILCEKPLASNMKEVDAMIESARANKVVLMEAMKTTCLPNFKAIQTHLHKLGPIRRYVANFCKISSRYDAYREGTILNAFDPTFSNGSLMDLGVYGLYPMVVLFGKPNAVMANGHLLESGVDGAGTVLAHYETMEGLVTHSKITDSDLPSEIQGENATMRIDKISTPETIEIRYRNGEIERISTETIFDSMYYEIEEFITCIQEGRLESTNNTHEHSRMTVEMMDEARKQMGLKYPADN